MASGSVMLAVLLLTGLGWAPNPSGAEEEFPSEWRAEAGGTWRPALGVHPRPRRALAGPCQLWSLSLAVAELGLGYASEEKVVFHYCAGHCPRGGRTLHSLTLARLRGLGRAHGGPCCQPTRYADVAFLDDRHRWQRLPQLSAAACGCGG